ncbi:MAG: PEP-CTERM sorting domain-containing protein, partial [Phycisphaeraceae bacterium]
ESFFSRQNDVTLILSDLLPGEYEITTFHHDSVTDHNNLGVRLTDMTGSLQDLGITIDPSNNTTGLNVETATFRFFADGINDIVIQFYEQAGSTQSVVLNGFALTLVGPAVPEPATMVLCLAAAGAHLSRRRRRAA